MRAVVQRVREASVVVGEQTVGEIGPGLLVYLGAGKRDTAATADWMARKLSGLRIFEDDSGRMARDVQQAGGEVLVVPQFTLYGDVRGGRRPGFEGAAPPESAAALFERVGAGLRGLGLQVASGRFRATMLVRSVGDGPVTILIDSDKGF